MQSVDLTEKKLKKKKDPSHTNNGVELELFGLNQQVPQKQTTQSTSSVVLMNVQRVLGSATQHRSDGEMLDPHSWSDISTENNFEPLQSIAIFLSEGSKARVSSDKAGFGINGDQNRVAAVDGIFEPNQGVFFRSRRVVEVVDGLTNLVVADGIDGVDIGLGCFPNSVFWVAHGFCFVCVVITVEKMN